MPLQQYIFRAMKQLFITLSVVLLLLHNALPSQAQRFLNDALVWNGGTVYANLDRNILRPNGQHYRQSAEPGFSWGLTFSRAFLYNKAGLNIENFKANGFSADWTLQIQNNMFTMVNETDQNDKFRYHQTSLMLPIMFRQYNPFYAIYNPNEAFKKFDEFSFGPYFASSLFSFEQGISNPANTSRREHAFSWYKWGLQAEYMLHWVRDNSAGFSAGIRLQQDLSYWITNRDENAIHPTLTNVSFIFGFNDGR